MPVLDAQWIERRLGVARTTKQQVRTHPPSTLVAYRFVVMCAFMLLCMY
jgi:hypothetical protein